MRNVCLFFNILLDIRFNFFVFLYFKEEIVVDIFLFVIMLFSLLNMLCLRFFFVSRKFNFLNLFLKFLFIDECKDLKWFNYVLGFIG